MPFCDHRIVEYAYNSRGRSRRWTGGKRASCAARSRTSCRRRSSGAKKAPTPRPSTRPTPACARTMCAAIFADSGSAASQLFDHRAVEALMEQPESLAEPWYGQLMRTPQIFAYIIQIDPLVQAVQGAAGVKNGGRSRRFLSCIPLSRAARPAYRPPAGGRPCGRACRRRRTEPITPVPRRRIGNPPPPAA